MTKEEIIKPENLVYKKPTLMNDNAMHYCPGCSCLLYTSTGTLSKSTEMILMLSVLPSKKQKQKATVLHSSLGKPRWAKEHVKPMVAVMKLTVLHTVHH